MLELDHIAVSGATLDDAAEAVEAALGVAMQPGGRHALFSTHNRLLGLDDGLSAPDGITLEAAAGVSSASAVVPLRMRARGTQSISSVHLRFRSPRKMRLLPPTGAPLVP